MMHLIEGAVSGIFWIDPNYTGPDSALPIGSTRYDSDTDAIYVWSGTDWQPFAVDATKRMKQHPYTHPVPPVPEKAYDRAMKGIV